MTHEFRGKPHPGDWEIPESFAAVLSPEERALLSESDYQGVPIGFTVQFVTNNQELLQEINQGNLAAAEALDIELAGAEERYPDFPGWDRLRSYTVSQLVATGHPEEAYQRVWGIKEPHILMEALFDAGMQAAWDQEQIINTVLYHPDEQKRHGLVRALRDEMIIRDHDELGLAIVNRYLKGQGVERDPVSGWAESQSQVYVDYDWNGIVATVKDDSKWAGLPLSKRQHALMVNVQFDSSLGGQPNEVAETVEAYKEWLDEQREMHDAPIWDEFAAVNAVRLMRLGDSEQARVLSGAIRDSRFRGSTALKYIEMDQEEAAIELILTIDDYELAGSLLMFGPWKDESPQAIAKMAAVMESDEYPLALRIGLLEFVREEMARQDQPDLAAKYQRRIDQLRAAQEE